VQADVLRAAAGGGIVQSATGWRLPRVRGYRVPGTTTSTS
jgi:hypothetical protein